MQIDHEQLVGKSPGTAANVVGKSNVRRGQVHQRIAQSANRPVDAYWQSDRIGQQVPNWTGATQTGGDRVQQRAG